jgi:serine/threonine protein kinase/uncharacterized protein HemY
MSQLSCQNIYSPGIKDTILADQLMVGKTISHYKIIEKLGGGGMGVVYRATDLKLNRTVALKFLPSELLHDPEAKKRFIREAQAASSLQHDNTCVIHDIEDTDDGQLFICMEFYNGETLKKKIERGPLPIENTIHYASQISRGLACAHNSIMIHRDIKPANIMVTESDEVKIVDFGLAHLAGQSKITKDGSTLGTVDYMSPEQTLGKIVDHRTDIWSLGVLTYEMATGERPFKGDYDQAVMYSIMNDNPDPPSTIRSDIPLALDSIVRKALEKEPENRYQSVNDMSRDLKNIDSVPKRSRSFNLPKFISRNSRVTWGIIVLLIISTLIISFLGPFTISVRDLEAAKNSIAVMICENRIDPQDKNRLGEIITDAMITDLMESQYVKVVSLQHLYDLLRQMGKSGQKLIAKSEQLEVAKRANVDKIVSSSIGQLGSQYVLTAQLIEVQSGDVLHSNEFSGPIKNIYKMIDSVSANIKLNLDLPPESLVEQDRSVAEVTTHSFPAYRHYLTAEELAAKYDMKAAASEYEKAVLLDSTFATAHSRLAAVYRFLKQKENAENAINKAFQHIDHIKERERYEIHFRRALEKNDLANAKETMFKWIERYPDDKLARYNLGYLYMDRFLMYDEAVLQFKKAIDLDNEYRLAYNYLGYTYAYKGMKEEAVSAINKYIELSPDEVNPYDSMGEIYMNLIGDYEKAEEYFKKALNINPDFTPHKLAELSILKGQFQDAEVLYQKSFPKETLLSPGVKYFLMARLNYKKGNYEKCSTLAETGKKLLPSYGNLYWLSGLANLKQNKITLAKKDIDHLRSVDPENKNYFHLLGKVFLVDQNYEQALLNLEKPVQMIDFISWYYYEHLEFYKNELAEAFLLKGDIKTAVKLCDEVIASNPNWANSYYLLGQIYDQTNSYDEALNAYRSFLNIWENADRDLAKIKYALLRIEDIKTNKNKIE